MKILEQGAVAAAEQLIGWQLYVREPDGELAGGIIVETEAYTAEDAASHSYRGKTPRNSIMFGSAGHIYVYFTYGMHWCMNIVTGQPGNGEAVLVRAIQPGKGLTRIQARRGNKPDSELTNGPAKLCQALGVDGTDNGAAIDGGRFTLLPPKTRHKVRATPRIGIKQDTHRLWRFVSE